MSQATLTLSDVCKFYGPIDSGVHAVRNLSMEVNKGEIVALLGSSGCGKTSTLRMVAGFENVSRGTIALVGRDIHKLPPSKRNVAMAFEGYSLYPPLTVRDNIAFALKAVRMPAGEVNERVRAIARLLEIENILDRYPSSISGGQQQRASLGRALIRSADLHLLDEPMGQLEPQLRALLRGRVKHFAKQHGLTAILVTHDQTEANALADRIAVMDGGVLQQFDTPQNIKERPVNLLTGTFVGEPPMNVFEAAVGEDGKGKLRLVLEGGLSLDYAEMAFAPPVRDILRQRERVMIGVRPYAVHRAETGLPASVAANQWLGDQTHIAADFAGGSIVLVEHHRTSLSVGDAIHLRIEASDLHIFETGSGRAIAHGAELAA
jgi:multiple sugar transport system ATP-binding protein